MCSPQGMHGVRTSFHRWFLALDTQGSTVGFFCTGEMPAEHVIATKSFKNEWRDVTADLRTGRRSSSSAVTAG